MTNKRKVTKRMNRKPLTVSERQQRRYVALQEAAAAAGYDNWSQFCTAVINKEAMIPERQMLK